jgi:protein CWC15
MTSAARPTFLPAVGGHSLRDTRAGPISLQSAKDLPGQLKMKYRRIDQDREELKRKLVEKERLYLEKVKGTKVLDSMSGPTVPFKGIEDLDRDVESMSESEEDSSEDEDDTEELMRELQKIKQERAEEERKKEEERMEEEKLEMEERAITGNPLINDFSDPVGISGVKRRWDEDVIFKNQARDEVEVKKRFINDMLRSDFHRKFMNKYVK